MKKDVEELEVPITDMVGTLPLEAIADTVTVSTGEGTPLTKDQDYELVYDQESGALIMELLPDGTAAGETKVKCTFSQVDPSAVTKKDIIGGKDAETRGQHNLR